MGSLFGSSKTTSTSRVELPGWANEGLRQTSQRALGLMDRPYQGFGGQRVAGTSDWTTAGAAAAQGAAGYQPGTVTPTNVTAPTVAPGSLAGRDLSAYTNPWEQGVVDAALSDIDRSTRVAQAGRVAGGVGAAGFGGFGDRSAVAGAEVERAGIDAKARTAAGLRSQGFARAQDLATQDINRDFQGQTINAQTGMQAGLANQQAGLGAQQFNVQAGLQGASQRAEAGRGLAAMGELERGVRQAGLDAVYQQFVEQRDDPFLKTQWAAGVIGGNASPYGGNVSQTQPGPSLFSQILGGGTSAAAMYALLSDPEDKTDKRRLGTDPDTGLGIWAYRYRGDSKRNPKVVGIMADEVEERYPHLVHRVGRHRVVDAAGLEALRDGLADAPGYAEGGLSGGNRLRTSPRWLAYQGMLGRGDEPSLPPIIEGVAEPVPMTDDWQGTPAVPAMGSRAPIFRGEADEGSRPWGRGVFRGEADEGERPWGGSAMGEGVGPALPPPGSMPGGFAGEAPEHDGRAIELPPAVAAALDRLRARRGGGSAGGASPARAALPGRMPDAMPADGPAAAALPVASGEGAGAPAAEGGGNWLRRFGDRLVDPEYAGAVALLQAGLGMMASRNPNWAGAIGEGALVGLQSAERARPFVQRRRQAQEFQDFLRGIPEAAPAAAPRRPGSAPAERPVRMASVAVPPGVEVPPELMPAFEAASRETGIPVEVLVAQARQESNFDPAAVGRAGEVGVMQIMPSTARDPGFGMAGVDPETLRDPAQNILFGARYLRARAGDADLSDPVALDRALAAYNGGGDPDYVANVRRWMPGGGAPAVRTAAASGGGEGAEARTAARVPAEVGEPTVQVGGRALTRSQLVSMAAAMPDNENVQNFVRMALPMLNQEAARRESAADRAQARQEAADLRREIANRGREAPPTELSRLMAERDALPQGDPRRGSYDAAIRRASGEATAERFTPGQIVQLRRDAFTAARQEAGGLDFDSEGDRSGWINQRARELVQEWGVPEAIEGPRSGGGGLVRLGASGTPEAPDATADTGARIRSRGAALTEAQARANLFGNMMLQAEEVFGGRPARNGEPEQRAVAVPSTAAIIAWRNMPESVVNMALSENDQRYFNAVRLFAAGILRKETGAAFTANELLDVQSRFFPMPGDSAATIKQKAEARRNAMEALRAEVPGGFRSGPAGGHGAPRRPSTSSPPAGGGQQRPPLDQFMR